MAATEDWLDLRSAVALIELKLRVSVGKAHALLVEACASGDVRVRGTPPIHRTRPAEAWQRATIDPDEGSIIFNGYHRWPAVDFRFSASDLHYWLQQRRASTASPPAAASAEQEPPTIPASEEAIREAMRRVYADAERAGAKPPNVKEAISATVADLHPLYHVARKEVERVADELEFKVQRVRPGEHFTKRRKLT